METEQRCNLDVGVEVKEAKSCTISRFPLFKFLHRNRGLLVAFVGALCYSCSTITVSLLKDGISVSELIFTRGCIASITCLVIMCYKGTKIRISSLEELKFHTTNSSLFVAGIFCQFYAYQNMPAADANAIVYSYVALTGLFGRVFLKEDFSVFEMLMVLFSFSGVILIARPPFLFGVLEAKDHDEESQYVTVLPALIALTSAVITASMYVVLRKMRKRNYDFMVICFYAMLTCIVVSSITTTISKQWVAPCSWTWLVVFISAFAGFSGYAAFAYALRVESTIYVSLVSLNEVLAVLFLTMIFFSYIPYWTSVLGVVFIMSSSAAILAKKAIISKNESKRSMRELEDVNVQDASAEIQADDT